MESRGVLGLGRSGLSIRGRLRRHEVVLHRLDFVHHFVPDYSLLQSALLDRRGQSLNQGVSGGEITNLPESTLAG